MSANAPTVELPEGVTPLMAKLGLLHRELEEMAHHVHVIADDVWREVFEMAPPVSGDAKARSDDHDAFWGVFFVALDRMEEASGVC